MPEGEPAAIGRLNDHLADRLAASGVVSTRRRHSVALEEMNLEVAVTAVWESPHSPKPGQSRLGGVEIALRSQTLFDEVAYEYVYGSGADDERGRIDALDNWIAYDLPVLTQAATGRDAGCSVREMRRNSNNGIAPGTWQIYLGPLMYLAGDRGAQPCCNDCLLVMGLPSLLPLMARPISFAVKLVASKDDDGTTSADCRYNGRDVPDAIAAIAEAARRWPDVDGLQMRRQYLYFRAPAPTDA